MPHCIIQHSSGLEQSTLINAVFEGTLQSALFDTPDIKTRATIFDNHLSGITGQAFVHVTAKILSGRSLEQRQLLSQSILSSLEKLNFSSTSVSVEIVEMEKESYAKKVT